MELKGPENIIRRVLEVCCDPQCTGMKRLVYESEEGS